MKIMIYSKSFTNPEELFIELVMLGILGIGVDSLEDVEDLLSQIPEWKYIVLDIYNTYMLNWFHEHRSEIKIIGFSKDSQIVRNPESLVKYGVAAMIDDTDDPVRFAGDIDKFASIERVLSGDRRKFIRVQPGPRDSVTAAIHISEDQKIIRGNILALSIDGFAVRVIYSGDIEFLTPGKTYKTVQINLKSNTIKATAVLISMRNDCVGFRFSQLDNDSRKEISVYIYKKFLEEVEKEAHYRTFFF